VVAFDSTQFAPTDSPDRCPYCNGRITREELTAIRARIREEETRKLNEFRIQLQEEAKRERAAFEKAAEARANERANGRIAEATKARDAALQKVAEIEQAVEGARRNAVEQARASWEAEKTRELTERAAQQARERAELHQQIEVLTTSKQEREVRIDSLIAERDDALATVAKQVEAAKKEAIDSARADHFQAAADQQKKLEEAQERERKLIEERDAASKASEARTAQLVRDRDEANRRAENTATEIRKAAETEIAGVRETLKSDYDRQAIEKAAEYARTTEGLIKKLADVQRQLENKTANELGDGAEINLLEKLRDGFPDDSITRIGKGEPGADIKMEILHKGVVAGTILFDSKNRKAWQEGFAAKLHSDKVQAEADLAILSITAFPKDKKVLCRVGDIIVTRPAHVCDMVSIVREQIIKLHIRGRSNERRAEKQEALYSLITSNLFRQKLTEADRIREQLEKIEVDEKAEHGRTWEKRGRMLRRQYQVLSGVTMEIDAVVEGDDSIEADR